MDNHPVQSLSLLDPASFNRYMQNPSLSKKEKEEKCMQQFDSMIVANVLEKSLKFGSNDNKSAAQSHYNTQICQVLADHFTQSGLGIARSNQVTQLKE